MKRIHYVALGLFALSIPAVCSADSYTFRCHAAQPAKKVEETSNPSANDYTDVELLVAGNSVTLKLAGGSKSYQGPLDTAYKPRTNKDMVRVRYDDDGEDSVVNVLIEKKMLEGQDGVIKITDVNFEVPDNYVFQVDACKKL